MSVPAPRSLVTKCHALANFPDPMSVRRNGTLVEGDMLVSGVLLSSFNHTHVHERLAKAELMLEGEDYKTFSSQLTGCTQERVGGLR